MLAADSSLFPSLFFAALPSSTPWSFAARSFLCHFYCSWHTQLHFSPLSGGLFLWLHPPSSPSHPIPLPWILMLFAGSHPCAPRRKRKLTQSQELSGRALNLLKRKAYNR